MKKISLSLLVILTILICNIIKCNALNTPPFTIEHISTNYNRIVEHNGSIVIAGDLGNLVYSNDQAQTWQRSQLENAFDNIDISSIDNQMLILGKNNGYYSYSNAKFMLFINENKSDKWKSKAIYSNLIPHFEKNNQEYYLASQDSLFIFNTSIQLSALALSNILKTTSQDTLINFKIFKNIFYFLFKNGKLISTNDKFEIIDDPYYFKEIDECKSCLTTNQLEVSEYKNQKYITFSANGYAYTYLNNKRVYQISITTSRIFVEYDRIIRYRSYNEEPIKTNKEMMAYESNSFIDSTFEYEYMRSVDFIMKDLKVNDIYINDNFKLLVGKNNLIFKILKDNKSYLIINNLVNGNSPGISTSNNNLNIKSEFQDFISSEDGDFWKPMFATKIYADSLKNIFYTPYYIDENKSFCIYYLNGASQNENQFFYYDYQNKIYKSKFYSGYFGLLNSYPASIVDSSQLMLTCSFSDLATNKSNPLIWGTIVKIDTNLDRIYNKLIWNVDLGQNFKIDNKLAFLAVRYKDFQYDLNSQNQTWNKELILNQSTDNGNTWDTILIDTYDRQYSKVLINQIPYYDKVKKRLIVKIFQEDKSNHSKLYLVDLKNYSIKKLVTNDNNMLYKMPFDLQDTFYFSGSRSNYLYYFKENKLEENNIDSLDLSSYFASKFLFSLVNIHKNEDVYTKLILTPASGNVNMLVRLTKKNKNNISSIDDENKVETSMYAYKPYPLPSKDFVFTKIYWDMSSDIDKSDISVFDIYGNKVADKSDIVINKE